MVVLQVHICYSTDRSPKGTPVRLTLQECGWIPCNRGQSAGSVRRDSVGAALAFACEQPDFVDPLVYAGCLFGRAAELFGKAEMGELAEGVGVLDG